MQIKRLEVKNYSRLADLNIELRRHAVIVGANDVGKSSLLRLLNLTLGSTYGYLYSQLSMADLRDASAPLECTVLMHEMTDAERVLFHQEIDIDPVDHSESLSIRLDVSPDEVDRGAVVVRRWFPTAGHDRGPTREQLAAFGWRYLPATRGTSAEQLDGPNSALQSLLHAIDLGTEKTQLTELLDNFNDKLSSSSRLKQLRGDVADHLSRSMPHSIGQDDLAVRTVSNPAEEVLDHVSMFFERDGNHVPLNEQSDGLRQLMAMTLFDLAEGAANIIAVDEPEIHLHPSSQRTIAELFASSTKQRLLVTHSPYIVQRFEPAQVIKVDPSGMCSQIAADKLTAVEKVSINWWSPRLLEALTARIVIVVEGTADRVLVEHTARAMGVKLDQCGAVTLELDGAHKFRHVYKLLGPEGFNVEVLGLVDDAEQNLWLGAIGGRPRDSIGRRIWVCSADLEDEYCSALTGEVVASMLSDAGFCNMEDILRSCGVSQPSAITANGMAAYCRKSKVQAAHIVGDALTATEAAQLSNVAGLLQRVRELAKP